MTRSGFSLEQLQRGLAVRRLEDLVALRAQSHAQQLADRRLVVDHQNLERGGAHAAVSRLSRLPAGTGRRDGEHGARAVEPVGGRDRAVHGLDEAARDRKAEARAGAHVIALLRAVELVEDALEVVRRNAVAFVEDLQVRRNRRRASSRMRIVGAGGRIFRRVVEEVEQHLLEQHRIELEHRQVRRQARARRDGRARILLARRSALPTISRRSCGAAFGATAPDSSLVMSSRLAMKRLSRSDSSMMVASSSAFSRIAQACCRDRASVPAAPSTRRAASCRSCEIEVSSAERRRSVSTVRLTRSMSSTRCTRSIASAP